MIPDIYSLKRRGRIEAKIKDAGKTVRREGGSFQIVALNIGLPTLVKTFLKGKYLAKGWKPLRQFEMSPVKTDLDFSPGVAAFVNTLFQFYV